MSKKSYSFYPGCSSQKAASASNYMTSVNSMCDTLDIELNEIPDWNCCSASIGYAGGGELPRLALSARNMALSEQAHPDQDIVATCAACWLATKETQERLHDDEKLMAETNEALAAAGVILAAVYLLWAYERVFTGIADKEENKALVDLSGREIGLLAPLAALVLIIGLFPGVLLDKIAPSTELLLDNIESATSYQVPQPGRLGDVFVAGEARE